MPYTDLADYDLLDLLLTAHLSNEQKGRYIADYMEAFAGFLGSQVASELTEKDNQAMKKLLSSPDVTPEKIENFYRERIPNFDGYLLAATLHFKKNFLLDFYQEMLNEVTKKKHPSISLWIKLVAAAHEDNWQEVFRLVKLMEEKYVKISSSSLQSTGL